ncbi:hypothetical protein K505DRAFT_331874 [Melanomma pulvis-pyrius CBS 109.77]|uniref:Uncharacterized protein n=1 Tax=Melanomma pulvis-pyrius CBS 109.77 TaxID=1314802 RepID=A0A6A6XUD5_9PLEO|nr:hypothetical protein K505DRAFT_331874 [Melanomma pulvis-pyrius CBS 109.77]
MPVPRFRGRDEQVEYVVVRRTGLDGEEETDELEPTPTATVIADQLLERSNVRRQAQTTTSEDDSDDDDDDRNHGPPPIPILITMTLPQAQATGGALAADGPTETVVVTFSPPPRPEGPGPGRRGGISQTTEHLLIAAGSIGATIIIVMILLAIHTMRKRGLTLAEAVKHGKYQVTRRGPPPPPPKANGAAWDNKPPYSVQYGSMRNDAVTPPPPAASLARSGSSSSQRPLMALNRSESFNRQAITERSVSPGTVPQSFLLDSPPRRNNTNNSRKRSISATPSSPVLPLQNPRRSASTRNTRSISEASELKYPEAAQETQEQALSPLRPPPTFKQFLFNRPSVSGRPAGPGVSRFSWTNSNAPQTPHDPQRDTNSHTIGRDSFMTQRSSVPRFRTINSWVDQQTNRLEEQKLRDQFRNTQMSTASVEEERDIVPEVPMLPKSVIGLKDGAKIPATPAPLRSNGLPGKNVKHERHDTRTTVDTAPIFRQHPGTEVRFSTRSAVPSEILDMGRKPNILS